MARSTDSVSEENDAPLRYKIDERDRVALANPWFRPLHPFEESLRCEWKGRIPARNSNTRMALWIRWARVMVIFIASAMILYLSGCKGFFIDPALTAVTVAPSSPSVVVGKTQQMGATGTYDDGTKSAITNEASWSSSNSSAASVSATGLVTGIAAGSATISATASAITGSTTVTVVTAALTSISITPTTVSLSPAQSQQFTAVGLLADGTTTSITTSVTWALSDTSIATIDSAGLCVAKSGATSGTTTITAVSGSVTSNAVTVTVK